MKLIVCVDEKLGMAFNRRRLSSDKALRARLLERTAGRRLFMNVYSAKQFAGTAELVVREDFLSAAGPEDWCFCETTDPAPYASQIDTIVLYRWNRRYPADLYFSIPPEASGRKLTEVSEFAGSSHEKITEEIYTR